MQFAATAGRVLITFNAAHFAKLHSDCLGQGRHHAGIAVSSQGPMGDMSRRLFKMAGALDAAAMRDRLEYLGDW